MQLCDKQIYKEMASGELLFVGPNPNFPFRKDQQVQPASVDLRLGPKVMRFKENITFFDTKDIMAASSYYTEEYVKDGEAIEIGPNEIIFGEIYEQICIPNYLSARVRGRSRISRLGLSVHCTGDYINPGFIGEMPLQIVNHNNFPVILYPYVGICQMVLYQLSDSPLVSYRQRLDLASNAYFNGTFPNSSWNGSNDFYKSNIAAFRIHKMVEEYYNALEREIAQTGSHLERQVIINEATNENLRYLNVKGDVYCMRDQYNSMQAGVQGPGSGSNATIHQYYNEFSIRDSDIQQMMRELEIIKKHLRSNYTDDEHVIIDGYVSIASKLLKEDKKSEALEFLKKSGKVLFDIAERIGCSVVARYLSNMLGF